MVIVTLSSKGQDIIPAKIRKKFSLRSGDALILTEREDSIILQPATDLAGLHGIDRLAGTAGSLRDLRDTVERQL